MTIGYSQDIPNTFRIPCKADVLVRYESPAEICEALGQFRGRRLLIVGEGSNLLPCCERFEGVVLCSEIRSVEEISNDGRAVLLKLGSGCNWDEFVAWSVGRGYSGAENLSLIPGQAGSAAVQNIGAYGVEISSLVESVETICVRDGSTRIFSREECEYGYRRSVFKTSLAGEYIVTFVNLRLRLGDAVNIEYGRLSEAVRELSPAGVREAVIATRRAKLPAVEEVGSAGSFFMNPVVESYVLERLKQDWPDIPSYPLPSEDDKVKLSAAWLIDKAGWKGWRRDDAGVWPTQALVLVNYGSATGEQIRSLAADIVESVKQRFGVELHPEAQYII